MTHDSVNWHYPDGAGCPSLDRAKQHVRAVLDWLSDHDLLSEFGREIHGLPVGADTAITSDLLTADGERLLADGYDTWLASVDYQKPPDVTGLDTLAARA